MHQPNSTFTYSFSQHPLSRRGWGGPMPEGGYSRKLPVRSLLGTGDRPTGTRRLQAYVPKELCQGSRRGDPKEAVSKWTRAVGSFNEAPAAEVSRPSREKAVFIGNGHHTLIIWRRARMSMLRRLESCSSGWLVCCVRS